MIVVFAAWRGVRALVTVVTLLGIGVFLLPALLHGREPSRAGGRGAAILMVVVPPSTA